MENRLASKFEVDVSGDRKAIFRRNPQSSDIILAPAILGASPLDLRTEVAEALAGGADVIHFDVMDGRFAPAITFGARLVEAISDAFEAPIDVHLLTDEPDRLIGDFALAGARGITVHPEACRDPYRCIDDIASRGIACGIALLAGSSIEIYSELLSIVDFVLIMAVHPGERRVLPGTERRIEEVRRRLDALGRYEVHIGVDGGVRSETVGGFVTSGASWLVAASAIFGRGEPAASARELRLLAGKARREAD